VKKFIKKIQGRFSGHHKKNKGTPHTVSLDTISKLDHVKDILTFLQRWEILSYRDYVWPWDLWHQHEFSDKLSVLERAELSKDPILKLIETYAVKVRTQSNGIATLSDLFDAINRSEFSFSSLEFSYQLELLQFAYVDKRWKLLETWSFDVFFKSPTVTEVEKQQFRAQQLIFEFHIRAIYMQAMPTYVNRPEILNQRLEKISVSSVFSDFLKRSKSSVNLLSAHRYALKGAWDEALPLYTDIVEHSEFFTPVFEQAKILLLLSSDFTSEYEDKFHAYKEVSSIEHIYVHQKNLEHALLVSCEQSYFTHYAELYCEIIGIVNADALIHFHLVNIESNTDELSALFHAWEVRYNVRINYSLEENNSLRKNPVSHNRSGITICSRYIYLPEYLEMYSAVTITDVDGWLTATIDAVSDFVANDVMISSWIWRNNTGFWRLPWGNLAGGYLSIKATDAGKKYACALSSYLIKVYQRNIPQNWSIVYADQAALFLLLQKFVADEKVEVGFMPKGGFAQSTEQRFGHRYEGKRLSMQKTIAELKEQASIIQA
jgi:hypothetical protein